MKNKESTKYKKIEIPTLERYVTSYKLSKKLYKLGIPQNGSYIHRTTNKDYVYFARKGSLTPIESDVDAFTAAELGKYLPRSIKWNNHRMWLNMNINRVEYATDLFIPLMPKISFSDDTEANLRAKLIIWLIENKYINI